MERLDAFMARANAAYYAGRDPFGAAGARPGRGGGALVRGGSAPRPNAEAAGLPVSERL